MTRGSQRYSDSHSHPKPRPTPRWAAAAVAAASLLAPTVSRAQEAAGFIEVRGHAMTGVDGDWYLISERIRPEFSAELGKRVVIAATVEAAMAQGRGMQDELRRTLEANDLTMALLEFAECTWPTESNETLGVSRASDYLSVERLYADLYLPSVDLRLGRQAVQWGSAFLVNPTDPFPEVLLTEPWRPRSGVNALRATVPLGESHQVQVVLGSNDDFTAMQVAGRATVGFGLTDLSFVGAWREETEDGIVGLDIRGTLELGYWVEAALHFDTHGNINEEIAVGVDYSFPILESLVFTVQYYRNGAGNAEATLDPTRLASAIEPPDCRNTPSFLAAPDSDAKPNKFAPFLRGRDYAMASVRLGVIPEIAVSGMWLQNLSDGTGLVVPTVSYDATDWLSIAAAAQVPFALWGEGGELKPKDDDLVFRTETFTDGVDLGGLVPATTFIAWSRLNF